MATTQLQTVAVQYNQIPKESALLDFPPLKKGDKVTFRLIGSYDPTNPKKRVLRTLFLPNTDVISDPDSGETYDIAYIKSIGPGGVPILGDIVFDDSHGSALTLHGNRAEDIKKYNFIMLSNYLKDNSNSDPQKHKIELESEEKDFEAIRTKREKVFAAISTVKEMSDADVLNFLRANNLPTPSSPGKRRFRLEMYAEKNPDAFAGAPLLDHTSLYDTIDALKKKKIVSWNNSTKKVLLYDGSEVLDLENKFKFGMSWKDELAKHLIKSENKSKLEKLKHELDQ